MDPGVVMSDTEASTLLDTTTGDMPRGTSLVTDGRSRESPRVVSDGVPGYHDEKEYEGGIKRVSPLDYLECH